MPRRKKILTAVVEPSPPAEASVLTGDIHYKPKAGDHVTFSSNGVEVKGTVETGRLIDIYYAVTDECGKRYLLRKDEMICG